MWSLTFCFPLAPKYLSSNWIVYRFSYFERSNHPFFVFATLASRPTSIDYSDVYFYVKPTHESFPLNFLSWIYYQIGSRVGVTGSYTTQNFAFISFNRHYPLKKGNLSIGRKIQDRQTKEECRDFDLTGKNTPCVSNNKGVRDRERERRKTTRKIMERRTLCEKQREKAKTWRWRRGPWCQSSLTLRYLLCFY